jgi:trigger factor
VNVSVEHLAPCKKLVRVELEAAAVDTAFEAITKDFQKQAALPGFRPGKAPKEMVLKKYGADIKEEAKRKVIGDAYRKALDEQKLKIVGQPDIEEVQFDRGQACIFTATVETAPEFELPEYKGLTAQVEAKTVTNEDVDKALDVLRGQQADFAVVTRPVAAGDIAVVNYTGTCEGKPITELAPTARGLTEQKGYWVEVTPGQFIPGFGEQLVGAQAGDKRTVNVDFPADFVTRELQGKKGEYAVEVVEVREKVLPPLDDALAKKFGAESLDKLREGVRSDLENDAKYQRTRAIRNQTVQGLLGKVNFDLPESAVANETRRLVYDLVRQNSQRGVSTEAIEGQKDQIYSAASANARDRVKLAFLVGRIAENEKIQVQQEDVFRRAQYLAQVQQVPFDQFVKELQKNNAVGELYEQVLHEKVLELLEQHAVVTEVAPAPKA